MPLCLTIDTYLNIARVFQVLKTCFNIFKINILEIYLKTRKELRLKYINIKESNNKVKPYFYDVSKSF